MVLFDLGASWPGLSRTGGWLSLFASERLAPRDFMQSSGRPVSGDFDLGRYCADAIIGSGVAAQQHRSPIPLGTADQNKPKLITAPYGSGQANSLGELGVVTHRRSRPASHQMFNLFLATS